MKSSYFPAVLLVLFSSSTLSCFAEEPVKLEGLRLSYERAIERATQPIKRTYLEELRSLKEEYTKAGRLDEALLVVKEIEEQTTEVARIDDGPMKELLTSRQWQINHEQGRTILTFHKDGSIKGKRGNRMMNWKWKIVDHETLYIDINYQNSYTELELPPGKNFVFKGKTKGGTAREMKPLE